MTTALRLRELYCPAHFGNSYEAAGPREMHSILGEARYWGFNRYSDWFDTVDLRNPYQKNDGLFDMPEAVWEHKFSSFAIAANLGFDLGLVVTPNHVFSEQVTAENEAEKAPGRIFGQLVCPSKPGVIEMILGNYRNLFQDFADRKLCLSAISAGAYDYGGCNCPGCRPWIVTFGRLVRRIVDIAREFFPDVEAELWGWWWSDEDHEAFAQWANCDAPGFFAALSHHIPYGETSYKSRPVPRGCKQRAFINIGYGETRGIDVYGHLGPTIAPRRLERTIAFLARNRADGFLAYSEGVCDDANKALVAGLGSGKHQGASDVLRAYAARYLGDDVAGWEAWLSEMGQADTVDPVQARRTFDRLAASAAPSWRLRALDEKLNMCAADAIVRSETKWNESRLAAARAFWAAKERLWRKVWGLGLGRHALKFDWRAPDWHAAYLQETAGGLPTGSHPPAISDEA